VVVVAGTGSGVMVAGTMTAGTGATVVATMTTGTGAAVVGDLVGDEVILIGGGGAVGFMVVVGDFVGYFVGVLVVGDFVGDVVVTTTTGDGVVIVTAEGFNVGDDTGTISLHGGIHSVS